MLGLFLAALHVKVPRPLRAGHGSGSRPRATKDYSIGEVARFGLDLPRAGLLALLVGGALLLIVGEFLTVREIHAGGAIPAGGTTSGGSHHGYALGLIGLALLPMAWGAVVGGSRPAAIAALVLALGAAGVVLFIDLPMLDETGLLGRTYELAEARPGPGFYVQSLGAALALIGAVGTLVFRRP